MADIISRLKLESGEFDSKIKRAGQELMAYSEHCRKTGLEIGYANRDAKEFAKALGNMQTTSATARGKISELSDAFVNLRVMYKNMTDEEKNNQFGKNLASSLDKLKIRIQDAKKDLSDVTAELNGKSGGGLFGGGKLDGMLQVFGGNLMTKGAGMLAGLASEMGDMVKQGVELAKQGEGIRIAFERLGRGDILDGLRQATHGTVTDIELMKAAVKFNDFKLPLDELGTMLAFAQQKAKDTGQSVDYMVDSIVTGLGRKSLMILDNLGLSATEVKDKMKETGDMTKAVGAIIREQMAKAGDYVETAADRAAQANVSLQNKMEELGRKFAPVEEASNQLWTSMKIGILDVIGGPLAKLLNGLTEAGRLKNMLNDLNGGGNGKESQTEKALRLLREYSGGGRGIEGKRDVYNRQVASYSNQEEKAWREANRLREELKGLRRQQKENGLAGNLQPLISETTRQLEAAENRAKAIQIMRVNYEAGAKQILSPATTNTPVAAISTDKPTASTVGKGGKTITEEKDDFVEINGLINMAAERVSDLQRRIREAPTESMITELRDQLKDAQAELDRLNGKEVKMQMETGTSIQNDAGISAYIASIKQQLETADYGTSLYNGLSAQLADMTTLQNLVGESLKAGLGTVMFDAADATGKDFWTRAMEGGVDNIDWQTIVDKINKARKDAGLDAISLDFESGSISTKERKNGMQESKTVLNAISQLTSGLKNIGIEIPSEIQSVISVMQGVMQVIEAVNTIIGVTQTTALTANTIAMTSLTAALWANTASSWFPFANGGVVHAAGGFVTGNTYSGDHIPAMLNAGEVVLNRAQTGNLASQLQGNGFGNARLVGRLKGRDILISIDRELSATGKGQLATWK